MHWRWCLFNLLCIDLIENWWTDQKVRGMFIRFKRVRNDGKKETNFHCNYHENSRTSIVKTPRKFPYIEKSLAEKNHRWFKNFLRLSHFGFFETSYQKSNFSVYIPVIVLRHNTPNLNVISCLLSFNHVQLKIWWAQIFLYLLSLKTYESQGLAGNMIGSVTLWRGVIKWVK